MDWRKMLFSFLEKSEDAEAATLLSQIKAGLVELDNSAANESTLKDAVDALTVQFNELKTKDPAPAGAITETPEYKALISELSGLKERDALREAELLKAKESETRNSIRKDLAGSMSEAFGTLTGDLLLNKYIDDGALSLNSEGKMQLTSDGVAYLGSEVLERIRTDHKDAIIGKPGPGTTQPGKTKTPGTTPDNYENMSAHELISAAIESGRV